jgi:hypothetical protein
MLFAIQPPGVLLLYPFRFIDPVTGKWTRARYVAGLTDIAAGYERWEITGPPEIRSCGSERDWFNPWAKLPPRPAAHLPPVEDPPPDHEPPPQSPPDNEPPDPPIEEPPPIEDQLERFLVLLFLRRYVTYCARRRRFAAMNGAAKLFTEVSGQVVEPQRRVSAKR